MHRPRTTKAARPGLGLRSGTFRARVDGVALPLHTHLRSTQRCLPTDEGSRSGALQLQVVSEKGRCWNSGRSYVVVSVPSVTIAGMDTATDEDHWVVPTRWWGTALPIRGLGPAPRERVSPDAATRAATTYDDATEFIASALDNPDSDPDLIAHGRGVAAACPHTGPAVVAAPGTAPGSPRTRRR